MKELMKALLKAGKKNAFDSVETFIEAAKALGYADEQINNAVKDFDDFPLDDDDLEEIVGGFGRAAPYRANASFHR